MEAIGPMGADAGGVGGMPCAASEFEIDGAVFWHACATGLEGIVAKRRDRPSIGALS